jgi:hypothetical protein
MHSASAMAMSLACDSLAGPYTDKEYISSLAPQHRQLCPVVALTKGATHQVQCWHPALASRRHAVAAGDGSLADWPPRSSQMFEMHSSRPGADNLALLAQRCSDWACTAVLPAYTPHTSSVTERDDVKRHDHPLSIWIGISPMQRARGRQAGRCTCRKRVRTEPRLTRCWPDANVGKDQLRKEV